MDGFEQMLAQTREMLEWRDAEWRELHVSPEAVQAAVEWLTRLHECLVDGLDEFEWIAPFVNCGPGEVVFDWRLRGSSKHVEIIVQSDGEVRYVRDRGLPDHPIYNGDASNVDVGALLLFWLSQGS